jgi:hypothetical protein
MTTITISARHHVPCDATAAWAVIADYSRDHEWRQGVVAMSSDPVGMVHPGATTSEELRFAGRTYRNDGVVLRVDEPRSFEWRTTAGADATGARRVEPLDGNSCRVTLELSVVPHGTERLMAPLLRRLLQRQLAGDLCRFAVLIGQAESTRSSSSPT